MKKYIKRTPLFWLLLFSGILFTMIGIAGKNTIYADQEYDPVKAPILSVMFAAMNDEIYPWQLFDVSFMAKTEGKDAVAEKAEAEGEGEGAATENAEAEGEGEGAAAEKAEAEGEGEGAVAEKAEAEGEGEGAAAEKAEAEGEGEGAAAENAEAGSKGEKTPAEKAEVEGEGEDTAAEKAEAEGEGEKAAAENAEAEGKGEKTPAEKAEMEGKREAAGQMPYEEIKPIRETTHEEYMAHISADIYGEAGVLRAAEYEFEPVDITWFDDALFIGDSRTVGLRDYTDLSEHADFYCETSLTIYKVLEKEFKGKGTVLEALKEKDYKKIYLMVGINELGTGTTENYLEKYKEVVEALHEAQPEAVIYVQAVMKVSQKKNDQDKIFNNDNINARNHAVATLADNRYIFYIDMNEIVCDEQGALKEEYTHDQIHLLGKYNELWKEFLLGKGVELPESSMETVKQTETD